VQTPTESDSDFAIPEESNSELLKKLSDSSDPIPMDLDSEPQKKHSLSWKVFGFSGAFLVGFGCMILWQYRKSKRTVLNVDMTTLASEKYS